MTDHYRQAEVELDRLGEVSNEAEERYVLGRAIVHGLLAVAQALTTSALPLRCDFREPLGRQCQLELGHDGQHRIGVRG